MRCTADQQYPPLCLWNKLLWSSLGIQLLLREEKEGISTRAHLPTLCSKWTCMLGILSTGLTGASGTLLWSRAPLNSPYLLLSLGTSYTYIWCGYSLCQLSSSLYPLRHVPSTSLAYLIPSWFCFVEEAKCYLSHSRDITYECCEGQCIWSSTMQSPQRCPWCPSLS